jgi:hypothetical protein
MVRSIPEATIGDKGLLVTVRRTRKSLLAKAEALAIRMLTEGKAAQERIHVIPAKVI